MLKVLRHLFSYVWKVRAQGSNNNRFLLLFTKHATQVIPSRAKATLKRIYQLCSKQSAVCAFLFYCHQGAAVYCKHNGLIDLLTTLPCSQKPDNPFSTKPRVLSGRICMMTAPWVSSGSFSCFYWPWRSTLPVRLLISQVSPFYTRGRGGRGGIIKWHKNCQLCMIFNIIWSYDFLHILPPEHLVHLILK